MSHESTTSTASNNSRQSTNHNDPKPSACLKHVLADYSLEGLIGWIDSAREFGVQIDVKSLPNNRIAVILYQTVATESEGGRVRLQLLSNGHLTK